MWPQWRWKCLFLFSALFILFIYEVRVGPVLCSSSKSLNSDKFNFKRFQKINRFQNELVLAFLLSKLEQFTQLTSGGALFSSYTIRRSKFSSGGGAIGDISDTFSLQEGNFQSSIYFCYDGWASCLVQETHFCRQSVAYFSHKLSVGCLFQTKKIQIQKICMNNVLFVCLFVGGMSVSNKNTNT